MNIVAILALTSGQRELVDQNAKDAPLDRIGEADETAAELRVDGGFAIR